MVDSYTIALLINDGKLESAEKLLLEILRKNKTDGELWFLRGLISLKRNNPNYAIETFNLAKSFGYENDLLNRGMGYAYFLKLEFEEAIKYFELIKEKDVEDYFMLAACYIMLKDPKSSREYLSLSYNKNPNKTKQLLLEFYNSFIRPSNELTEKEKEKLLERIKSIKV